ncbi:MAG: DUF5666 domain-containing protein, partial [Rhodothermales bacterium]|nr:DUF5666 domain-containing protein [Rhodothermales bacterium]
DLAEVLVVDGLTFFVDDATEVVDDDGTPILFSDLVPGLFVEVEADVLDDGTLLAHTIEVEDEDGEGDDEVEVEGFIEELGADFLVVDGLTFLVDDATEVRGEDGEPILFGDLTVGTFVEVEATVLDDGRLLALEIEVDAPEDEGEDEFEITGTIEEIGADYLVVNTLTFRVDDETLVLDDDDRVIRFADLGVGLLVEVHAAPLPDGTLLALEIEIEDAEDDEVEITGTIEAIGASSLLVGGVLFTVTDATLVLDDDDQPLPFAVLTLGMLVEVEAETGPGGRLLARRIEVEDRIEDEVAVTGVAERVAEDAVGVLGRSFRLLPRTEVFDASGNAISPAALRAGQTLAVRGDLLPGGTLVALRIAVQETPAFRVLGPVEAMDGETLSVLGVAFFTDAATVFLDAAGNPAAAGDAAVGRTVVVEGEGRTDGTRRAATVRLEDVTVAAGRLDAVGAGTLTLAGLTITLDAQTLVRGPGNAPLPAAALVAGQRAEVRAVQRGTATVATKIRLLETSGTSVAAEDDAPSVPAAFVLHGNYPNPFNPQTTIAFELKTPQAVSLVVYDAAGREVVRLVEGELGAGAHRVAWDGRNEQGRMAASGVYLYRLRAGGRAEARTMLLVK